LAHVLYGKDDAVGGVILHVRRWFEHFQLIHHHHILFAKKRRRATRKAEAHHTLVAHYIT